eukprot:2430397-Rhodomonas_salina.1
MRFSPPSFNEAIFHHAQSLNLTAGGFYTSRPRDCPRARVPGYPGTRDPGYPVVPSQGGITAAVRAQSLSNPNTNRNTNNTAKYRERQKTV